MQTVQFRGRPLHVRELTPFDVHELLGRKAQDHWDVVFAQMVEGVNLTDLAAMCGVERGLFAGCKPSDLAPLVRVARQVNPGIFRVRQELSRAAVSSKPIPRSAVPK